MASLSIVRDDEEKQRGQVDSNEDDVGVVYLEILRPDHQDNELNKVRKEKNSLFVFRAMHERSFGTETKLTD